jgi:hypothetical protein
MPSKLLSFQKHPELKFSCHIVLACKFDTQSFYTHSQKIKTRNLKARLSAKSKTKLFIKNQHKTKDRLES